LVWIAGIIDINLGFFSYDVCIFNCYLKVLSFNVKRLSLSTACWFRGTKKIGTKFKNGYYHCGWSYIRLLMRERGLNFEPYKFSAEDFFDQGVQN